MGESFNHQNDAVIHELIDSANATFANLQNWIEYCEAQQVA
jgi:hypothetical protein